MVVAMVVVVARTVVVIGLVVVAAVAVVVVARMIPVVPAVPSLRESRSSISAQYCLSSRRPSSCATHSLLSCSMRASPVSLSFFASSMLCSCARMSAILPSSDRMSAVVRWREGGVRTVRSRSTVTM